LLLVFVVHVVVNTIIIVTIIFNDFWSGRLLVAVSAGLEIEYIE
jgi:hypothetical protein